MAPDPIARLVENGFDYRRFSTEHYRIEGVADFWPSTKRWRFLNGRQSGFGAAELISALVAFSPDFAALYAQAPARHQKGR